MDELGSKWVHAMQVHVAQMLKDEEEYDTMEEEFRLE
jgi:hypothetical protein